MEEVIRHKALLPPENTGLLIIDVQQRVLPAMFNPDEVLNNTLKLLRGFKVLGLPIFYTEQYPKGLGRTAEVITDELAGIDVYEKMTFSCYNAGTLFRDLDDCELKNVVVAGIEAHVCVLQTTLDLIANGMNVYLCADAVSSRRELNYKYALDRCAKHGAEIVLVESVLFELMNICGTDQFKAISKIVK